MEIITGRQQSAIKTCIYGPEGIGKTTFAAHFPRPVFIDTEGSTRHMDVHRTPKPSSFAMLLEQVRWFRDHPDEYATLVVDTADWAEQLCAADLCARTKKTGIEDFGYGKGYVYLAEDFGKLLNLLEEVVDRGVHVVVTAHAKMRKFEQPDELGAYDRWELKLQKSTAPLLMEWADMVLFANYKTTVVNVDGQGALKGKNKVQGGRRIMYTTHHPCWDAKNRFDLPEELPFDFSAIAHVISDRKEEPPTPAQSTPVEQVPEVQPEPAMPQPERTAPELTEEKNLPPHLAKLYALMQGRGVEPEEVQAVVGQRGYFPPDMPIEDYPEDFVTGVLVGAWDQVYTMIAEAHPLPF